MANGSKEAAARPLLEEGVREAGEAASLGEVVQSRAAGPGRVPVEIVVPVYDAPDDARRCIESVLAHTGGDYRLVLIDDASPDPGVTRLFDELAWRGDSRLTLLHNEHNLGFTGTANRGLMRSRADVVLLNSDTTVTPGWLDAILRCAASDPRIGTITPFSNNAEICSFPRFCVNNAWPDGADPGIVANALAAAAVPTYPELPTGVGFCMFVPRALLDAIGGFDPAFGAGYGEENDLCMRAAAAGFRNVLCDDAFVLHTGGRSFADRKTELGARNLAVLLERHPRYLDLVRDYIAADPLRPLREAALTALAVSSGPARGVLHVIHDHGGGTEAHVRALIDASRTHWRHYLAIAVDDAWQIEEHRADGALVSYAITRSPGESWCEFLRAILATLRVGLVHLHNISHCRDGLLAALDGLGVPYGYTVHDLNFACPTITLIAADGAYCGGETDAVKCARCLAAQPEFARIDIVDWRTRHARLVASAAFLIAPSQWAADMFARYFPGAAPRVIAHGSDASADLVAVSRSGLPLPDDEVPTVAVLGAIGPDKGARRLERLVELARAGDARVRFVLIGYLDVEHGPWQSEDARFTIHGHYAAAELPAWLAHYRVALVLYPSAGPETFSFTLTEAWAAGRPVLVPPIGALAQRVEGTGAGFVLSDAEWRDEARMLARILALVDPAAETTRLAAAHRARRMPQALRGAMAEQILSLYSGAYLTAALPYPPLARARMRDALGYRPWAPPVPDAGPVAVPAASPTGAIAAVARAALRVRHTALGALMARITPAPVLEALKARLK